jgi:hypothetical protein
LASNSSAMLIRQQPRKSLEFWKNRKFRFNKAKQKITCVSANPTDPNFLCLP